MVFSPKCPSVIPPPSPFPPSLNPRLQVRNTRYSTAYRHSPAPPPHVGRRAATYLVPSAVYVHVHSMVRHVSDVGRDTAPPPFIVHPAFLLTQCQEPRRPLVLCTPYCHRTCLGIPSQLAPGSSPQIWQSRVQRLNSPPSTFLDLLTLVASWNIHSLAIRDQPSSIDRSTLHRHPPPSRRLHIIQTNNRERLHPCGSVSKEYGAALTFPVRPAPAISLQTPEKLAPRPNLPSATTTQPRHFVTLQLGAPGECARRRGRKHSHTRAAFAWRPRAAGSPVAIDERRYTLHWHTTALAIPAPTPLRPASWTQTPLLSRSGPLPPPSQP